MRNNYEYIILEAINNAYRAAKAQPLVLGAVSSGAGGPPGGIVGYLPQTRVAYDAMEAATSGGPPVDASGVIYSGSILDNLNHIRYRLDTLEAGTGGSGHIIEDEGSPLTARVYLDFVGSGVTVTDDSINNKTIVTVPGGGGTGHTIEDESTPLTARTYLNFVGSGVTVTDDSGNDATLVTIQGGTTVLSGGHVIQDEGSSLTTRTYLDFVGSGVSVTDDSINDRTIVTISGGGSSSTSFVFPIDDFSNFGSGDSFAGTTLDAGWTSLQSTAVTTVDRTVDGYLQLLNTGSTSTQERGLQRSFSPAGDFTAILKMNFFTQGASRMWSGLFVGDSDPTDGASGHRLSLALNYTASPGAVKFMKWDAGVETSVFAANFATLGSSATTACRFPLWLRIRRSGSNLIAGISWDGFSFWEHGTTTTIAFTVATLGVFIGEGTATLDLKGIFDYIATTG